MADADRPRREPALDRTACERVLLRALELQDGDLDCGSLSEADLLEAGSELGLAPEHLRRALAEERARGAAQPAPGRIDRLAGPSTVGSSRIVAGSADGLLDAVDAWLRMQEGLRLERRLGQARVFQPRGGVVGPVHRALTTAGGHETRLAKASAVTARVAAVDDRQAVVRLEADLAGRRRSSMAAGAALGATGTAASVILAVAVAPVAVVGAVPAAGLGLLVLHAQSREARKMEQAIERALDAVEAGERAGGPLSGVAGMLGRAMERRRRPAP